ncbi:MAG: hypothetical protein U9N04_01125 [Patescibacteria group bacterium]|nr:hypothetical protein [Patescibacteria group bacterium]
MRKRGIIIEKGEMSYNIRDGEKMDLILKMSYNGGDGEKMDLILKMSYNISM